MGLIPGTWEDRIKTAILLAHRTGEDSIIRGRSYIDPAMIGGALALVS